MPTKSDAGSKRKSPAAKSTLRGQKSANLASLNDRYISALVSVDVTKLKRTKHIVRQTNVEHASVAKFKQLFGRGEYGAGNRYISVCIINMEEELTKSLRTFLIGKHGVNLHLRPSGFPSDVGKFIDERGLFYVDGMHRGVALSDENVRLQMKWRNEKVLCYLYMHRDGSAMREHEVISIGASLNGQDSMSVKMTNGDRCHAATSALLSVMAVPLGELGPHASERYRKAHKELLEKTYDISVDSFRVLMEELGVNYDVPSYKQRGKYNRFHRGVFKFSSNQKRAKMLQRAVNNCSITLLAHSVVWDTKSFGEQLFILYGIVDVFKNCRSSSFEERESFLPAPCKRGGAKFNNSNLTIVIRFFKDLWSQIMDEILNKLEIHEDCFFTHKVLVNAFEKNLRCLLVTKVLDLIAAASSVTIVNSNAEIQSEIASNMVSAIIDCLSDEEREKIFGVIASEESESEGIQTTQNDGDQEVLVVDCTQRNNVDMNKMDKSNSGGEATEPDMMGSDGLDNAQQNSAETEKYNELTSGGNHKFQNRERKNSDSDKVAGTLLGAVDDREIYSTGDKGLIQKRSCSEIEIQKNTQLDPGKDTNAISITDELNELSANQLNSSKLDCDEGGNNSQSTANKTGRKENSSLHQNGVERSEENRDRRYPLRKRRRIVLSLEDDSPSETIVNPYKEEMTKLNNFPALCALEVEKSKARSSIEANIREWVSRNPKQLGVGEIGRDFEIVERDGQFIAWKLPPPHWSGFKDIREEVSQLDDTVESVYGNWFDGTVDVLGHKPERVRIIEDRERAYTRLDPEFTIVSPTESVMEELTHPEKDLSPTIAQEESQVQKDNTKIQHLLFALGFRLPHRSFFLRLSVKDYFQLRRTLFHLISESNVEDFCATKLLCDKDFAELGDLHRKLILSTIRNFFKYQRRQLDISGFVMFERLLESSSDTSHGKWGVSRDIVGDSDFRNEIKAFFEYWAEKAPSAKDIESCKLTSEHYELWSCIRNSVEDEKFLISNTSRLMSTSYGMTTHFEVDPDRDEKMKLLRTRCKLEVMVMQLAASMRLPFPKWDHGYDTKEKRQCFLGGHQLRCPDTGGRMILTSTDTPTQLGHLDFVFGKSVERAKNNSILHPPYFVIVSGSEGTPIWIAEGSHRHVGISVGEMKAVGKTLKMQLFDIPPWTILFVRGDVFHAGCGAKETGGKMCPRFHLYLIRDGIAIGDIINHYVGQHIHFDEAKKYIKRPS